MKIKYVQLESSAFLTDIDYIVMSHAERSVYCTLIFYLTSNNGKCEYKPLILSKLCHCENVEEFEEIWQGISKKFQTRNNVIKHKRVTKELRRAKKFIQHQRKAGLASAKKRQQRLNHGLTDVISPVQPTKTKGNVIGKESKSSLYSNPVRNPTIANIGQITSEVADSLLTRQKERISNGANTSGQFLSSSTSARAHVQALNFNSALINIIKPRTQSDRTCFRNITKWLTAGCAAGQFNNEIFGRVLDYAEEASAGRNPAAVFMALLKKELNYQPGK